MTFRDLQRLVQSSQSGPEQSHVLQRLRDKPFWIWIWDQKEHRQEDIKTKGDCCFNHIMGLPRKDGIENWRIMLARPWKKGKDNKESK